MASSASVVPRQHRDMSMREVFLLCDRLKAHAQNALFRGQPLVCEDMRLAALSMEAMTRSFHRSDLLAIEE
jgi:hypothetical protein